MFSKHREQNRTFTLINILSSPFCFVCCYVVLCLRLLCLLRCLLDFLPFIVFSLLHRNYRKKHFKNNMGFYHNTRISTLHRKLPRSLYCSHLSICIQEIAKINHRLSMYFLFFLFFRSQRLLLKSLDQGPQHTYKTLPLRMPID